MTCSSYRKTLGGVVLLDYGQRMTSDPTHPVSAQVQETGGPGAKWGRSIPRQNMARSWSWNQVLAFDSKAEAETMALQIPSILLSLPGRELFIEVEGGGATKVHDFSLTDVTASIRTFLAPNELLIQYNAIGHREETVSSGGFGELIAQDDLSIISEFDTSKISLF